MPKKNTPLADIWLTLMREIGVPIEKFRHSKRAESSLTS